MPIDFYRCKKHKKKLNFKTGEWLNYPINIQKYLNSYSTKRFIECKILTDLSDIGDILLSYDEVLEIMKYSKISIKNIEIWDFSEDIYKELKEYKLNKQDLQIFFENLYTFLEKAKIENENVYSIGE